MNDLSVFGEIDIFNKMILSLPIEWRWLCWLRKEEEDFYPVYVYHVFYQEKKESIL